MVIRYIHKIQFLQLLVISLLLSTSLYAQSDSAKVTLDGYVKDMQGFYFFKSSFIGASGNKLNDLNYNLIHNRLNLNAYPSKNFIISMSVRNRFYLGNMVSEIPPYATMTAEDNGWVDLSWNIFDNKNNFLNTSIDRLFVDYTFGNWEVKLGRQRINWCMNLVWNPNDLFNAYSFFDFDYEERPGSDALLVTWYPSYSSSLDVALKAGRTVGERTYAAKYRFNIKDYDIQFLSGISGYDVVAGGGWSGNLGSWGFRGEATAFFPLNEYKGLSDKALSASISTDYTFPNSFYMQYAVLYNTSGSTNNNQAISLLSPNLQFSAKNLSLGRYELFAQCSYPFATLYTAGFSAMMNPSDMSFYVAPSLQVSLGNNLSFYVISQLMLGKVGTEYASMGNIYAIFGRLKWSF